MEQLPANRQKITNKQKGLLLFVIIAFIIMGYAIFHSGSSTSSTTQAQPQDESSMAYIQSQQFVKQYLKAPSTASFPLYLKAHITKDSANQNLYYLVSYVDAENGFGAKIRSNWATQVLYKGGDDGNPNDWELQSLILDDKVMYDNK